MPGKKRRQQEKSLEQLKIEAERSQLRQQFKLERLEYLSHLDEEYERKQLARRWQQWSEEHSCHAKKARLVESDPDGEKPKWTQHDMWFHKANDPWDPTQVKQVTISLLENDIDMNSMVATLTTHPLAVGSDGRRMPRLYLTGKVNDQSTESNHESTYNLKFCSLLGFNLTFWIQSL